MQRNETWDRELSKAWAVQCVEHDRRKPLRDQYDLRPSARRKGSRRASPSKAPLGPVGNLALQLDRPARRGQGQAPADIYPVFRSPQRPSPPLSSARLATQASSLDKRLPTTG